MRQYIDTAQDLSGNALPLATCKVLNFPSGTNATIFSDNGLTPIGTSIVSADVTGQFSFFAADGDYTLQLFNNGTLYKTQTPVSIFDGAAQVTFADTGAVNAYASANSALEKALRVGLRASILAANTNTGASTYAYNGLAAKPIVLPGGVALPPGTIVTGGIASFEYDGASWQVRNSTAAAFFGIIPAETAAAVTPVNFGFLPGWDLRYGVVRDDATDNQTALTNCISVCKQTNGPPMVLTAGVARHSGTLNWGFQNLQVQGLQDSFLRYTGGVGPANLIDGGAASAIFSLSLDSVYELGNANATYCWDIRSVHRSKLFLRGKNCTLSGVRVRFGVLNWFDLRCSQNDGVGNFTTTPVNGVIFDVRNVGEGVAFSLPSHIIVEGVSGVGFLFQNSQGSGTSALAGMYSGASEGNGSGVSTDTSSLQITFQDFDCEGNLTNINGTDWNIQGQQHQLINTNSTSAAATDSTFFSNCEQITLRGGFHRSVNVQASALDTLFLGVGTSDNGALGFHGPGTFRQISTVKYNTATPRVATVRPADILGSVGTFVPLIQGGTVPGTQTYAANGNLGYFSRVGTIVSFSIWFNLTANGGGGTGNATINGLPFLSRNATNAFQTMAVGEFSGVTLNGLGRQLGFRIAPNGTSGILIDSDSGVAITPIPIGNIGATANIIISGSYQVDPLT